jgi:membrane protease YdiL (CAAX protease family)
LQTFIFSSLLFGGIHLLNVFAGGGLGSTVLQACYSVLTGGMFAFVLIKTKNIFFCAFTHGLYNFCGTLFSETGLGTGVVFDLPTALAMTVVSLFVAVFVFWGLKRYTEKERVELYSRLGFGVKPLESDSEETIEKAF